MSGCECKSSGSGVRHSGSVGAISPLEDFLKLGDGQHIFMRLRRFENFRGNDRWTLSFQLFEIVGNQLLRRVECSVPTEIVGVATTPLVNPIAAADVSPFVIAGLKISRAASLVAGISNIEVSADISLGAGASQRVVQKLIAEDVIINGRVGFGVIYRCEHDTCSTWGVEYNCNYRCQSAIVSDTGSVGEWHDTGFPCGPTC